MEDIWPTDPLNLALHGSNEIVCVSYWGFIPKVHFKFCLILLYIIESSKWENDSLSVLYKILSKVFQLQITKYILKMYFNYFCQLLWTRGPKYYTFNEGNLNTKYIQESLRVNQSINQ